MVKFIPDDKVRAPSPRPFWVALYVSSNEKTAHTKIVKTTTPDLNGSNTKDMLPGLFIEVEDERTADIFVGVCLDPENTVRGNIPRSGLLELIAYNMRLRHFNNFDRIFKISGAERRLRREPFKFYEAAPRTNSGIRPT